MFRYRARISFYGVFKKGLSLIKDHQIRLKDVAEIAGVSVGTVDRVLHDRGEVASHTREKVLEAIKKLDYTPNIIARSLALKKNFRIAVLIPESASPNDYWYGPLKGVEQAEKELNAYKLKVEKYFFRQTNERSFITKANEMIRSQPDAALFSPLYSESAKKLALKCRESGIVYALIDSNMDDEEKLTFIGQDSFRSGYLVGKLMSKLVRRQKGVILIAVIGEESHKSNQVHKRIDGFIRYFEESDRLARNRIGIQTFNYESDGKLKSNLIAYLSRQKAAGVFIPNSRSYLFCDSIGSDNLKDMTLIGYDLLERNIEYLEEEAIDFLIAQNPWQQGYKATISVFERLAFKKEVKKETYIPIDIITKENYLYYINGNLEIE